MLREAQCVLSETEGNAKLIHYFSGNVLFPEKDHFNKSGGCVCLRACLCGKFGNLLPEKHSPVVCCLRLLNVILVYSPTPGHII